MHRSKVGSVTALWLIAVVTAMLGVSCSRTMDTNTNNAATKSPTPDDCVAITDKQIVDNIYSELAKVADLRTQLDTINVSAKSRAVTLMGWVLTEDQRKNVVEIADTSKCVAGVTHDNFYVEANVGANNPLRIQPGGGCVPNYIRCGDICIPSGTGCGLELASSKPTTSATISNTNLNSNSNSTVNSNTGVNVNTNTKKY